MTSYRNFIAKFTIDNRHYSIFELDKKYKSVKKPFILMDDKQNEIGYFKTSMDALKYFEKENK